ncbi:GMC oxidoreductase [Mycena venus]|uniref:GMC oxidoreductase n=1 Tax=Mycena venus TaxID=2733690 RepID=A0A8H6XR97_9AGAR|nr:GMC oxidoreductase [Mycena venus]
MSAQHDISGKTFNYVIIGGGTAGLALASRLSEDPSITVAVLEAGEANLEDPNILLPAQFGKTFGNPKYDWAFLTEKQQFSNGKEFIWSRGKGLGGSSGLNLCAWIKPPAADIDAIEKLGNPGWNWDEYIRYSRRSESFHPPAQEQMDLYPHTYETKLHGTSGPIHTTIPFHCHAIDLLFQKTLVNKGLKTIKDPYGGDINGTWIANANYDPQTWTRSYATTGYFLPARDRPNLTVLTEATVTRILFDDVVTGQQLTATGVEFVNNKGTCQVYAEREVILSAGAIQSPQILELSGIGRPEILKKIGVELKIELDGVGENVQDHTLVGVSFELAGSPEMYAGMRDPLKLQFVSEKVAARGVQESHLLPTSRYLQRPQKLPLLFNVQQQTSHQVEYSRQASESNSTCNWHVLTTKMALTSRYSHSRAFSQSKFFPSIYFLIVVLKLVSYRISAPEPQKSYITILSVLNHPLSRGTIHAKSGDPFDLPSIDPHYFEKDFDLEILVQHIKYVRTMVDAEPLKSSVIREVDPGPNCKNTDGSGFETDYIKNTHGTSWRKSLLSRSGRNILKLLLDTIGSCSMLPREKQGVVDPELKVINGGWIFVTLTNPVRSMEPIISVSWISVSSRFTSRLIPKVGGF